MDLAENALFKSYGVTYLPIPHSTVPDELSIDKGDSNGLFLRRRLCTFSDSSSKSTDLSLFVVK